MSVVYIGNKLITDIKTGANSNTFPVDNFVLNPAAKAFVSSSGLVGYDNIVAVNNFVNDLQSYGIWDELYALYPFVGGTEESSKWNLKDTTQYNINWSGSWTYDSNGITGNGVNTVAKTGFRMGINTSGSGYWTGSASMGVYSRTAGQDRYDMGAVTYPDSGKQTALIVRYSTNEFYPGLPIGGPNIVNTNGAGFFSATRSGSLVSGYNGSNRVVTGSRAYFDIEGGPVTTTGDIWIGGINPSGAGGGTVENTSRNYALSFIGKYMDQNKMSNFGYLVQNFQTALGRQVSVPSTTTSTTTVAPTTTTSTTSTSTTTAPPTTTTTTTLAPGVVTNFINATGITGSAITAVQDLYDDLVTAGIWNNMIAIYPFVGANSNSHRYNLANTGSYTLTFNGGWTHNSNGVTSNGTNAYATMGITPSSIGAWGVDSMLGVYNRTDGPQTAYDIGSYTVGNRQTALITEYTGGDAYMLNGTIAIQTPVGDSRGLILWNQYGIAQDFQGIWKNGTQLLGVSGNAISVSSVGLVLGALNAAGSIQAYAARNYALAIVARGMSGAQISALNTAVTSFETALGRQV